MSICIIEVFVKLREMLTSNIELRTELEGIKAKMNSQDKNIELVFQYLDELLEKNDEVKPRKLIGYKFSNK